MNIAFVNATRKWGGVKTWILDFAETLSRRGHTIRIYGRQDAFVEAAKRRVGHGVQATFGCDLNPFTIRRFMADFRRDNIQVVFVNVEKDLATAGVAAKLLGIPVIQQIGLPEDIPHRLKTSLLHHWIDPRYLCSCEYIAQGFIKSLPYIVPSKVHVVLTAKRISAVSTPNHTPRKFIVTQQLNPDKQHACLLEAFATITTPYELHIAGTGSSETELKQLAERLGISKNIIWHGFSQDIPGLLRQCDIFLLASISEGLPNTMQEAMSEGLLPIMRDVGGVREVLVDELNPWVLPFHSGPSEFSNAIQNALQLSDDELTAIKDTARHSAATYFELEAKASELEQYLNTLVSKK